MINLKKYLKTYSKTYSPSHLFTYSPKKNGFTIIEVVAVFLLILGVTFFVLPLSLETTKQAKFISEWTEKYSELEYMFSVIKAQKDSEIKEEINKAQNNDDISDAVLDTIKPYLRITSEVKNPKYKQSYMDKKLVQDGDKYYFNKFFQAASGEAIGLKWIDGDCTEERICAIMTFDINGTTGPNTWGYDIFGINLLKNRIEPIGKDIDLDVLKNDCSKSGYGVYCSYYYLIGGKFD